MTNGIIERGSNSLQYMRSSVSLYFSLLPFSYETDCRILLVLYTVDSLEVIQQLAIWVAWNIFYGTDALYGNSLNKEKKIS